MRKMVLISAILLSFVFSSIKTVSTEYPSVVVPDDIRQITEEIGAMYGVCPELLQSICFYESSFRPYVGTTCKGLMQVSERWHKERMKKLGVTDLYDPYGNILVATDYIMELSEEHESISLVLDLYNGNSNAFQNEEEGVLSSYARQILELSEALEREHEKESIEDGCYR